MLPGHKSRLSHSRVFLRRRPLLGASPGRRAEERFKPEFGPGGRSVRFPRHHMAAAADKEVQIRAGIRLKDMVEV